MTIDINLEHSEREAAQLKHLAAEENILIDQSVEWIVREKLVRHYFKMQAAS